MKNKIKVAGLLILSLLIAVSCSPEKVQDGKTAATKKTMTSEEFAVNKDAIKSLSVVEAYALANSPSAQPSARSLSEDGLKLTFQGEEKVSTDTIIIALEKKKENATTEEEKLFYTTLIQSLPSSYSVEVKKGSFVIYKEEKGIKVISSLDITIVIDGKTIEIEKDEDEKWLEIDGTFFDNTELEKMLDAAEDASEALEEFFNNLKNIKLDFNTIISGESQKFSLDIKDDGELEARIEGSFLFKITDEKKLSSTFDFKYTEYEDDGTTEDEEFTLQASLSFDLNPLSIADIKLSKIIDASVKINGMDVWTDAFLEELE